MVYVLLADGFEEIEALAPVDLLRRAGLTVVTVSVEDGPLKGFFGTVKEINQAAQKAKISTTMFGRETDVEVEYVQIEKLDGEIPEQPEEEA